MVRKKLKKKRLPKIDERKVLTYLDLIALRQLEAIIGFRKFKDEVREYLDLPPWLSSIKKRRTQPQIHARFFLRLVLSKHELEIVEGDLLESYEKDLKDLGQKRADWLMYKQVAVSIWPFVKRLLYKIGAIAWITQAVRRLIGG